MLRLVLLGLLLVVQTVTAVETPPVGVTHVVDGDTIEVDLMTGVRERVRIIGIDTPESKDNSHGQAMAEGISASQALGALLPDGAKVRLWSAGPTLERDRYGRMLAVILLGDSGFDSVEERMIAAGWTVYWRKYGEVGHPDLHRRWLAAEAAAKEAQAGGWKTIPKWMTDKSNERTASPRALAPPGPRSSGPSPIEAPTTTTSSPAADPAATHWLNTSSGVRHNSGCKNFGKTSHGRPCSATDGRPCGICGG